MKVYTLGTGHGDSTFSRFNSSTVYETNSGRLYMIDAGAPAEALLRRRGLLVQDLRAVFLTHMHDDHVGGLTGLLKQAVKYPSPLFEEEPIRVFFPEERAIEPFRSWFRAVRENAESRVFLLLPVCDGTVFEDDEIHVEAIRTCHLRTISRTEGEPCSFAYLLSFKKEGKKILHTGDLSSDFSDFPSVALKQPLDLCVCEATHYSPWDNADTLKAILCKKLIFNHVASAWHIRVGSAWDVENGERELLSLCAYFPYPVQIAHDGDEFLI